MTTASAPLPSHQARADQPHRAEHLTGFSSWPAQGASPDGYFQRPLSGEAVEFYRENGFLVLEDALTREEIAEINADAAKICRGDYGDFQGTLPAPAGDSDADVLGRYLCIHFPDKTSPVMARSVRHPSQVEVTTRIIGPNVKCMQSMLFIKSSGKPGQAWHQDEFFIPTRDRSLTGGWMALDDATVENGCLWVIPGSHKPGVIWPAKKHDDRRFDCTGEAQFPYEDSDAVPVEVKAGSIVFFNGYLLHRSLPNQARGGYRRALVNHYMSAESLLPWHPPQPGEAMGTLDYRDIVMVAGKDPYAYKPITNVSRTSVRPSGEGGCEAPKAKSNLPAPSQMGASQMGAS
jgi:phytanoyl-CoA hydroxylase